MNQNIVRLSSIAVIIIISIFMIGFIFGVVESQQLREVFVKSILVIGVLALAFIGIASLVGKK